MKSCPRLWYKPGLAAEPLCQFPSLVFIDSLV